MYIIICTHIAVLVQYTYKVTISITCPMKSLYLVLLLYTAHFVHPIDDTKILVHKTTSNIIIYSIIHVLLGIQTKRFLCLMVVMMVSFNPYTLKPYMRLHTIHTFTYIILHLYFIILYKRLLFVRSSYHIYRPLYMGTLFLRGKRMLGHERGYLCTNIDKPYTQHL